MEASRKKLDECDYCYKKGKSRSRQLSTNDGNECSEKKRIKISKEIRLSRITELQEQIKDNNEQVQYKELRREAAKTVHNYKECDKLTEQMSVLKSDRRRLELELATLTKKQKKSEWYFERTSTPLKVSAPQLNSPFDLPSVSPEPTSPSSICSPSTAISSSLNSTPSPRVRMPLRSQRFNSPQSDDDTSSTPYPHDSDGTVILSSGESSSELPQPSREFHPSSLRRENSGESSSELPQPSSEFHPPSLRRERAFWKPNEPVKGRHDCSQHFTSTSISPSCPSSEDTSSSVSLGQHFQ